MSHVNAQGSSGAGEDYRSFKLELRGSDTSKLVRLAGMITALLSDLYDDDPELQVYDTGAGDIAKATTATDSTVPLFIKLGYGPTMAAEGFYVCRHGQVVRLDGGNYFHYGAGLCGDHHPVPVVERDG